jgi:hypothetical protein
LMMLVPGTQTAPPESVRGERALRARLESTNTPHCVINLKT